MDRQDRRRVLLRCVYGVLIFSLCGVYLLSSPVTPGPIDIRVGDRYVISLLPVTALSDAPDHGFLVGNYTGHRWPGNIPTDEPARIEIAADNSRLMLLQICSHEVRHFELEQAGVAAVKHHEVMADEGANYVYPWNWKPGCLQILPHILY